MYIEPKHVLPVSGVDWADKPVTHTLLFLTRRWSGVGVGVGVGVAAVVGVGVGVGVEVGVGVAVAVGAYSWRSLSANRDAPLLLCGMKR